MLRFLLLVPIFVFGCGDDDDKGESLKAQLLPSISEAIDKARPVGMVSTFATSASLVATDDDAAEALRDFFTDDVSSIGGHTRAGWIDAYVYDLDQRLNEVQGDSDPSCLSATAVDVLFDTGVGHSLTLKLSCLRSFEVPGDQSGAGSGLAYGRDDENHYVYVMLAQKADPTQKFGYAAIVNRATEAVELLFLERSSAFGRTKFFMLKTVPAPKSFAFAVAATGDGVGPVSTNTTHTLAPGVRFIANESLLRVAGTVGSGTDSAGVVQNSPADFDANDCFDSTNLATAPSACSASAPTFTSDFPLVTATAMPDQTETINSSLQTMQSLKTAGVSVDEGPPPPEE